MISLFLTSVNVALIFNCVAARDSHGVRRPQRVLENQKATKSTTCDMLTFSNMFVFGDSLSDQGNFATLGFPLIEAGFATNGMFAVEYIAQEFNLDLQISNHLVALSTNNPELITGTNYAVVQAQARAVAGDSFNLPIQVGAFMLAHQGSAPPDALYFIFIGGNDVIDISYVDRLTNPGKTDAAVFEELDISVKSIIDEAVQPLIDAGALDIVVVDSGPTSTTPFVSLNQPEERAANVERANAYFNNELKEAIIAVEALNDMNIIHHQEISDLTANIENLGLVIDSPCVINFSGIPGSIPPIASLNGGTSVPAIFDKTCVPPEAAGFAAWDELHPTTVVHEITAEKIIDQIRAEICRTSTKAPKSLKATKSLKASKSPK